MGLVKISDLKPEVRDPLLALAEGRISNPITGEDGVHILKRGARVPSQQMAFEDIKEQIRELLINQAQAQLRKAIYDQARQTYPVSLADSKIEEWRLRLRTNVPVSTGAAAKEPGGAGN
jgi:parvulin-like peptidyl-prolyl isomerase